MEIGKKMLNLEILAQYWPSLLKGTLVSLQISVLSSLLGFSLGTILGFWQTGKNNILASIVTVFVTIIRGTPMLIQIAFMYIVVFPSLGVQSSALYIAIFAIGINSSAYICEVIRSGIQSVNSGQIEAAKTLGLTSRQIDRYIVFPQAFKIVLPSLGNEVITLIKDSSLASTIGVMELFKEGKTVINQTYDAITVYMAVAVIYLVITSTATFLLRLLEKRVSNVKN